MFIVGGMMLGAVSLLAPRPEASLAFIIPTGLAPTLRLALHGDEAHLAMGLLAGIFTFATLITTRRIHLTITSSLMLQFENQDLLQNLQSAKNYAEALNEELEVRVRERTAELQRSTEQLRSEITQREQIEDELLRARKLESLGVLAGGIAHWLSARKHVRSAFLGRRAEQARVAGDPRQAAEECCGQAAGRVEAAEHQVCDALEACQSVEPGDAAKPGGAVSDLPARGWHRCRCSDISSSTHVFPRISFDLCVEFHFGKLKRLRLELVTEQSRVPRLWRTRTD